MAGAWPAAAAGTSLARQRGLCSEEETMKRIAVALLPIEFKVKKTTLVTIVMSARAAPSRPAR
jgi:hypothetical protein